MKTCYFCTGSDVTELLNFGPQPICNRFLKDPADAEAAFPLAIGQCPGCGLIQLNAPAPADELRPRYDWITYSEPEPHLDAVAETLRRLPGISPESRVCGISFKDDTLLRRLRERGVSRTRRIELENDLGVIGTGAGAETIQSRLTPSVAQKLASAYGKSDLVIARHIVEHAHNPPQFFQALCELVHQDGYVMLEAPDCERSLALGECTTIWEEHTLYLTPQTFRDSFAWHQLDLIHFELFHYAFENCLVGVGKVRGARAESKPANNSVSEEVQRGTAFVRGLSTRRDRLNSYLTEHRRARGKIALFGAGHLGAAFVNLQGFSEHFSFVADDNPNKRGLFMPGSRLPILASGALVEQDIRLCLLSLSLESEDKVIAKNKSFVDRGGCFASIFPASKHALQIGG
ncbi:MAG: class I SAM-dependent methyltransferase [Verrucomicrobia bacterium]|nr:class I SAM-dependent methyltransferase [Verrucomicrobiota bacterium]